jgi:hypothetical protein
MKIRQHLIQKAANTVKTTNTSAPSSSTSFVIPSNLSPDFDHANFAKLIKPVNSNTLFNLANSTPPHSLTLLNPDSTNSCTTVPVVTPNAISKTGGGIYRRELKCQYTCSRLIQLKKHLTTNHNIELKETTHNFSSNDGKIML